jgi:predicted peptidase
MTITEHKQEIAFGTKVNYKLYQPKIPSDYWLIFLHGSGEKGVADGSQLYRLDLPTKDADGKVVKTPPATYLTAAQAGFEFPFNIIAPQCVSSFALIKRLMPGFVKLRYGAKVIIVTGLSMGGYGTVDTQTYDDIDQMNLVDAIAVVCGGANVEVMKKWPEVNGWFFHGNKDTIVSYKSSETAVKAYNDTHTTKIKYTLYDGVAHNAWTKAYSVTPGQDELLQWFKAQFESHPKEQGTFDQEKFLIEVKRVLDEMQR